MTTRLDRLIPAAWEGWVLLFELADEMGDWTIVGGQMVQVLAAEYGAGALVRPTEDVDIVVDVRALRRGTERLGQWLEDRGVAHAGASPDGIGHRYSRKAATGPGRLIVDVLAPEGVGRRARLWTKRPARTIEVPGATQALERTELVGVTVTDMSGGAERSGMVRRPTLVAAIVAKAAATTIAGRHLPDRDWQDAALLLSLVPDPFSIALELTKKDRGRLACLRTLEARDHVGWRLLDDDAYLRGTTALEVMLDQ